METKLKEISKSEQEVEVTLGYDEIKPEIDEAYNKESKNLTIPGFRKGKAPRHLIKKMFGDAIEYKASEDIAQKKFWEIADEKKLEPVSAPQLMDINFVPGEKLTFVIRFEVKPEFEVKDYKGNEIEKPVFKVKDEDIDKELEYILKSHAEYKEADAVEGNNFRIKVQLTRLDDNNEPMEGQESGDIDIELDNPQVNPQIQSNAQGKSVGDTFSFSFVDEHMHGEEKHVVNYNYSAEILKIEKRIMPEVDEELLKKLSSKGATNVDELKAELKDNFQQYYDSQAENIYQNNLLDAVIKKNDFTPPSGYVDNVYKNIVEREKQNAARAKQPFNEKAYGETLRSQAEFTTKWQIIMENLAKQENIKVDDEDLEKLAAEESEKIGISKEKLVNYYKSSNRDVQLLEDKVINFLKENNTVKEVDPEEKAKQNEEKKAKEE